MSQHSPILSKHRNNLHNLAFITSATSNLVYLHVDFLIRQLVKVLVDGMQPTAPQKHCVTIWKNVATVVKLNVRKYIYLHQICRKHYSNSSLISMPIFIADACWICCWCSNLSWPGKGIENQMRIDFPKRENVYFISLRLDAVNFWTPTWLVDGRRELEAFLVAAGSCDISERVERCDLARQLRGPLLQSHDLERNGIKFGCQNRQNSKWQNTQCFLVADQK